MAAVTAEAPLQTAANAQIVQGDTEKNNMADHSVPEEDCRNIDTSEGLKQNGVERMEALATVTTKRMLIVLFILYVASRATVGSLTLTIAWSLLVYTWLLLWTYCSSIPRVPCFPILRLPSPSMDC